MKMDRDINKDGKGKYALVKLREISCELPTKKALADAISNNPHCLDFGEHGEDSEFFIIRLKDKYAPKALAAYARSAELDGNIEWARSVFNMAQRSERHKAQKIPD